MSVSRAPSSSPSCAPPSYQWPSAASPDLSFSKNPPEYTQYVKGQLSQKNICFYLQLRAKREYGNQPPSPGGSVREGSPVFLEARHPSDETLHFYQHFGIEGFYPFGRFVVDLLVQDYKVGEFF